MECSLFFNHPRKDHSVKGQERFPITTVGNAGKGAAIGAGVGAGAGLLGQSKDNAKADKKQQQAASKNQQNRQTFNRAYGVCLEGRGYKVG